MAASEAKPNTVPPWVARVDEVLQVQGRSWAWLARRIDIDGTILNRIKHGGSHGRINDLDERQRDLVAETLEVPKNWIFQPAGMP
jgi:hypothetical protein